MPYLLESEGCQCPLPRTGPGVEPHPWDGDLDVRLQAQTGDGGWTTDEILVQALG